MPDTEARKSEAEGQPVDETALFRIGVSPHIRAKASTTRIMAWVIGALMPITIYGVIIGGWSALLCVVCSIAGAVVTEWGIERLRKVPVTIGDLSAVVTGLLLALTLPPKVPFWIPLVGGAVAIALGKQVFGGLGHNIFNPALVGRAVVLISWPLIINNSYVVRSDIGFIQRMTQPVFDVVGKIDAVSSATPLFTLAQQRKISTLHLTRASAAALKGLSSSSYYKPYLFGNPWGCIGEVSAILLLLGFFVLLVKGIVNWRVPVCYVGTVAVLSWIIGMDPLFAVLSGGLLLGACFMATDYVTNPMTAWGKVIFGVGCGVVTVLLRFYSSSVEGVMFAILLMNGFTPLIDRYIKPKPFGAREKLGVEEA